MADVIDARPSPTLVIDADDTVLLANSAWVAAASILDTDLLTGVGGNYFDMALSMRNDSTSRSLIVQLNELARGERTTVESDYALPHSGGVTWFHLQGTRVGTGGRMVVTHTDVTSRVRAERAATWRARHDHLTELPNRAHLHELIDVELRRPDAGPLAVLFLDVDGFKDVNDSLGHEVGDDLLRRLAARLSDRTRAEDTVGRLGGDEFVVIGRDCDAAGAQALAQRFQSTFDLPFHLRGRTARQRATLAAELLQAIERDQLVLHYQPIVSLPSRRCSGVEALVRWQHPERGLLQPGDFLPTAEQHDLVTPLAHWVLRAATRQTAAWNKAGLTLVTGVNINASHFASDTLVADVMGALAAAGLDPGQLVVELTEPSVADDPERAAAQFAELRRRGVEVSIDDVGSGFSSLGQLVTIPAGILKIHRSVVAFREGRRQQTAAAIAAVVALGQACGIRSLAEGVETAEQLDLAVELGCSYAQGFHIARPMPADEVLPWMAAHRAARAPSVAVPV